MTVIAGSSWALEPAGGGVSSGWLWAAIGIGVLIGALLVYAWADPRIGELTDDLGQLPLLYAQALEDLEDVTAQRDVFETELTDAEDRLEAAIRDRDALALRLRAEELGIPYQPLRVIGGGR